MRGLEALSIQSKNAMNVSSGPNTSNQFYDCANCEQPHCVVGLSTTSKVIYIFLSLVCGIFAVGGNLALLVALYRTAAFRDRLNYCYIISLALADLFIGLTMTPLYICYALVYYPPWLVKFEGFLWIVTVTATTYSLSAVSLDRFISVVYPLHYPQVMTEKRCYRVIFLIWLGSIVFGFPRLVLNDFEQLEKLWIACSVATIIIPSLIMSFSYGKIFASVQRQRRSIAADSQLSSETLGNKKGAVTIGIIVGVFVVTFLPSAVVYFMLLIENDPCKELQLNYIWLWVALVSFTHSSFNPWVYGFRYLDLRKAIKQVIFL